MKKNFTILGALALLVSFSSYIVEEKEKVYVEPKREYIERKHYVDEDFEVVHPHHRHYHDEVIIDEHHPVVEEKVEIK